MAITLLEMLLDAGMLTAQQIDDALQHRVFYGGKIGTSLVELGFLREEDLAQFLSRKLSVPYVPPDQLLSIPSATIALLPRDLALKYKSIPLALEKKRLHLVMADPSDLAAIDNIAFITGYVVKPLITPEFRLIQALGQYYQMEISPRYQKILARLNAEPSPPRIVAPPEPAPVVPPLPPLEAPPEPFTPFAEAESELWPEELPPLPAMPDELAVPTPAAAPGEMEEVEPLEDVDVALAQRVASLSPAQVSRALARVEDRDEIAGVLLDFLSREFSVAALFIVRGDVASGWKAFRDGREVSGFDQLHIPYARPSVLKTVSEGKSFYLGPLADTPLNARLVEVLGGKAPTAALLMPVVIMGRVVDVIYLEGDGQDLSGRVSEVQKLLVKAAYAFEMLICREKILLS